MISGIVTGDDNMKLEAAMLRLNYDNCNIISIQPIKEYTYSNIKLGVEDYSKKFVTRSHFRDGSSNQIGKYLVVIGFKLHHESDGEEQAHNYRIKFAAEHDCSDEEYIDYDERDGWYFEYPKFKKGKVFNDENNAAVGSVVAGNFYVKIFDSDNQWIRENGIYTVKVLPSGVTEKDFVQMINDMQMIERELLIAASHQSINIDKQNKKDVYELCYENIITILDKITPYLKAIDKRPHTEIVTSFEKVSLKSLRKFNNRTIAQILKNPYVSKITDSVYMESRSIPEHTMIYNMLQLLKKYCEDGITYYEKEINDKKLSQKNDLINEIRSISKFLDGVDLEKFINHSDKSSIQEIIKTNNSRVVAKQKNNSSYTINTLTVKEINESSNVKQDIKLFIRDGQLQLEIRRIDDKLEKIILLKSGEYKQILVLIYFFAKKRAFKINIIQVLESGSNGYLCEISDIESIIDSDNNCYTIDNWYSLLSNLKRPDEELFILLSDKDLLFNDIIIRIKNSMSKNIIDACNYYLEIKRKLTHVESIKLPEALRAKSVIIKNKIDILCNLDVFKQCRGGNQKRLMLKPTQIFLNDTRYRKVFEGLTLLEEQYAYSDNVNASNILITKTDRIYEYWVLVRIIKEFMRLGWRFKDYGDEAASNKFFASIISKLLKKDILVPKLEMYYKKRSTITGNNNNKLFLDWDSLNLIFEYEKQIDCVINGEITHKKPDYTLKFSSSSTLYRSFIIYLDAKYRNYKEQGNLYGLRKDIETVSYEKYYKPFKGTENEPVGSFIIHSDVRKDAKLTYWNGIEIFDKNYDFGDDDYVLCNHMLGGFSLAPSYTDNLTTLCKLVMQFFYYQYLRIDCFRYICVECGSSNVSSKSYLTRGDNTSYRMTCNDCGENWNKTCCISCHGPIFKNYIHKYELPTQGSLSNVKCPECSANL